MNIVLSLAVPLLVLCESVAAAGRQCYWPDGTTTDGVFPGFAECFPNNPQGSQCCREGELTTEAVIAELPWANLLGCDSGQFWCGTGTACQAGNGNTLLDWPAGSSYSIANSSERISASDSSNNSSNGASSSTAATAAISPTTTVSNKSNCAGDVSVGTTIGVGVGIGVAFALLAAVFATLWLRTRQRMRKMEKEYGKSMGNFNTAQHGTVQPFYPGTCGCASICQ
ncbi:hypothetical protein MRB53_039980 [Persea americana]|nr:hypothetical protein MRB53_039980 [Persea americana]